MFKLISKLLINKVIDLKNIFIMEAALFENSIPMKSRSWVWKYFSISSEDSSTAICSICKLKITRSNK